MKTLFAIAVVLAASVAQAEMPRAVVTGPKDARPGSLVVLDATESVGLSRIWLLAASPEPTSFLPVDGGLKCIFASPTPGAYQFVLVVAGTNNNGGAAADMAVHVVTLIGTGPPVVPPPIVPTPDPTTPPTTSGVTFLTIIRDNQQLTADQAQVLAKLRTWSDGRPAEITHLEINPDAGLADGRLAGYVSRAEILPWLIISRGKSDGSGAVVLWDGVLPGTLDEVTKRVAEVVK